MATAQVSAPAGSRSAARAATWLVAAVLLPAMLVGVVVAANAERAGADPAEDDRARAESPVPAAEGGGRGAASSAVRLGPALLPTPTTVLDAVGNTLKESSVELLDRVLCEMAGGVRNARGECTRRPGARHPAGTTFDPGDPAWVRSYALASGVALFVLALLLIRVFVQAGRGEVSGDALATSLFHHLPFALLLVLFAPAMGGLFAGLADALTAEIIETMVLPDGGSFVVKLGFTGAVASGLPGGLVVGLVLFLLVLGAGIALLVQLVLQQLALYLGGVVLPVAFVGLIDPTRRSRALRAPAAWLGVLAAKPTLFFLLGCVLALADHASTVRTFRDDGIEALFTMLMAVLALLAVAIAPGSLLRWTPLLPGPSGASGALPTGAIASLSSDVLVQAALSRAGRVADVECRRGTASREGPDGPAEGLSRLLGIRSTGPGRSSPETPTALPGITGHARSPGSPPAVTTSPGSALSAGSPGGTVAAIGATIALHAARTAAESARDLGQRVGAMAPEDGGEDR